MEVLIDNDSATIINSEEIINKMVPKKRKYKKIKAKSAKAVGAYKTPIKHTKSERMDPNCNLCCKCRKKGRLPIVMAPDAFHDGSKGDGVHDDKHDDKHDDTHDDKHDDKHHKKVKPCVCGSAVCKKRWEKLKRELNQEELRVKPCVCGTSICLKESRKLSDSYVKNKDKIRKQRAKKRRRDENEKKYQKERLKRQKLHAAEDLKRWHQRQKQDKREMHYINESHAVPDCLAVTDSLTDLCKVSGKAFCDLLRGTGRLILHPRDGIENVKMAIKDPKHAAKGLKDTCEHTGFFAAMSRIKKRFSKMQTTKNILTRIESNAAANFVLHLPDKDPKHRMQNKKHFRKENMDFECSLFMSSLRKRPCLRVYYLCPWFYPHCVNILAVWKQFTDIILFILAVGVWSPCILLMELCRAMVCCCLCTG